MKMMIRFVLTGILGISAALHGQSKVYDGPRDGAGDPHLEREARMVGNRVLVKFRNNTELGDYPPEDASRFPIGIRGNVMHNGISLLIGGKVYLMNDTIPVTDKAFIEANLNQLDVLYFAQTNYREEMDRDATGQVEWGFHPAPGYMNPYSETPAISNDLMSWPTAGWPTSLSNDVSGLHWPGEWDGRFGRGQTRADLECFFVANDAQDLEYLGADDRVKYYPRGISGIHIGDINPEVSIQNGQPWGGLGIRVKQRGFQWNNPMAQDCIFWEYAITNISDYDLPYIYFGLWIDNDIGGENTDGENGFFEKTLNMAYTWDLDGVGSSGYPTGTQGFAFLESPGNANDMTDNDDDGLIDERRDNDAGVLVGAQDGIDDLGKFLDFYGLGVEDLKPHWSGDEDQDWNDGFDENKDGNYMGEWAGDDVGLDGVAPGEPNYTGPDADGTECNHQPDINAGYAEPNFGWTDVSETDMLGLTTLIFREAPEHVAPYTHWFRNDQSVWEDMTSDTLHRDALGHRNLFELFASGPFTLYQGRTGHISLAELHSFDNLSGLNSDEHSAPALIKLKQTVQIIYEKDYRFAQPPLAPTLTATPGDGFVQLTWDDKSDKLTRENFLNGVNDFEGYKLYRATDKDFSDPISITDGYGTPTLKKPIFECDLKNNIKGFAKFGQLNGIAYYLGSDNGLAYSYKDDNVRNGVTYYYALVAYDYGIAPGLLQGNASIAEPGEGIAPSENNVVIRKDEFENIQFVGQNVAVVTPGKNAAGLTLSTDVEYENEDVLIGRGTFEPVVVSPDLLMVGHQYKVKFLTQRVDEIEVVGVDPIAMFVTNGIKVYDVTDGHRLVLSDCLIQDNDYDKVEPKHMNSILESYKTDEARKDSYYHLPTSEEEYSEIFDGLQLRVQLTGRTASANMEQTGWMPGNGKMKISYTKYAAYYPWDYNIVFSNQTVYTGLAVKGHTGMVDESNEGIGKQAALLGEDFNFMVVNTSNLDSTGQPEIMDLVVYDVDGDDAFDILKDKVLVGRISPVKRGSRTLWYGEKTVFVLDFTEASSEAELPAVDDLYAIRFSRPFMETDSLLFTMRAQEVVDEAQLKLDMKKIRVVPNPYVATNLMEPSVINKFRSQQGRIMFTNIPEYCTIQIFTVSGVLIREINAPEDGLVSYNGNGDSASGAIHWDLKTDEGLDAAAGMYIYHIKSAVTSQEKIGKFAIIK